MAEKIFTIPLRKDWLKAPRYKRGKRAIHSLRDYLSKHLKKEVRIGKYLNSEIWARGNRKPPARVKIRIEEDKDKLTAELINAPREIKKEEKKKGKLETLKDKVGGEKREIKETAEELNRELNRELEKENKKPAKEAKKEMKETVGMQKLVPRKEDIKK